jgi:transcriptional regulator with XRE-family HTH domain
MRTEKDEKPIRRLHGFVQSVCGLYSRVARKLRISPSFVSRVARGERQSVVVENALLEEFAVAKQELQSGDVA